MNNADMPAFGAHYAATPVGDVYNSVADGMGGLTKREYFAAMAMQGYIASYAGIPDVPYADDVAAKAVQFADALIKELEK